MNEELKAELEMMLEMDQKHRQKANGVMCQYGADSPQYNELWKQQGEIDKKNIGRLIEIIQQYGWPSRSLVGGLASGGAFLVLQHSELTLQKKFLPILREATAQGEFLHQSLALLEDRILSCEDKPQIYGSQLYYDEKGKLALWPIENESGVDERRAAVGLEPLELYLRRFDFENQLGKGE